MLLEQIKYGYGQVRAMWLSFTYMGIVLLLVAHNRAWLRRLGAFGWTGRMALTLYMLQIAVLDLTFSPYTFRVQLTTLQGLAAGILLFLVNAASARWWLRRFPLARVALAFNHLRTSAAVAPRERGRLRFIERSPSRR